MLMVVLAFSEVFFILFFIREHTSVQMLQLSVFFSTTTDSGDGRRLPSYYDNLRQTDNIYTIKDETLRYNFFIDLLFLTPHRCMGPHMRLDV